MFIQVKAKPKDKAVIPVADMYPNPKPTYSATSRPVDADDCEWVKQKLKHFPSTGLHWWLARDESSSISPSNDAVLPVPIVSELLSHADFQSCADKVSFLKQVRNYGLGVFFVRIFFTFMSCQKSAQVGNLVIKLSIVLNKASYRQGSLALQ